MAQGFFPNIGLPPELAVPIGIREVVSGFAILVGALTIIVSMLFMIEMIGATLLAKISDEFVGDL
jgi:putative oxidoreductase